MLSTVNNISAINMNALKAVYAETIDRMENDDIHALSPYTPSEMRFVEDMRNFFQIPASVLLLWNVSGNPVAALRCEPYEDGALISYFETKPEMRCMGYGKALLSSAIRYLRDQGVQRVYSHIGKRNRASLSAHKFCGFKISSDYAKLLDGTVSQNYCTMLYESTAE